MKIFPKLEVGWNLNAHLRTHTRRQCAYLKRGQKRQNAYIHNPDFIYYYYTYVVGRLLS